MKQQPSVAPSETAVLVVDVQNDFVHERGRVGRDGADMQALQHAVHEINRLVEAAHNAGTPVIYIAVEHGGHVDNRPYQERYERRGMTPDDTICHTGTWGAELYPDLIPPAPSDLRLVKHGYDAFEIPELAGELRRRNVRAVVVTGVVTELCVRATAMSAFEKGFLPIVPRETTASNEPAVAQEAMESIERWYGEIVGLDDLLDRWRVSAASGKAP